MDLASRDTTADRRAARELAGLFATPDGLRALRLLRYASRPEDPDSARAFQALAAPVPEMAAGRVTRVGIWEPESADEGPRYMRRTDLEPPELWSQVEIIPPRHPRRKRVVLVGESVARGVFQDPHYNPAIALQQMLSTAAGEDVEVIDLARIDISMVPLLALCRAALQLQPDAILIFAGNNWHPTWSFRDGRLPEVSLHLRDTREWTAMKRVVDATLARHVSSFVATLGTLLQSSGMPAVFLVPEFNLGDWRDISTPPALLPAADTARWLDLRGEAERALARPDPMTAAAFGRRLLEIDRGSTPIGYYVLAEASRLADDVAETRRQLRLSREVPLYWPRSISPGIYAAVRQHLIDHGPAAGLTVVDLQHRLEDWCGSGLPDRRLFLDYCHLSVEGIRVCMAQAAASLAPMLGVPAWPADRFAAIDPRVTPEVIAAGHVVAAVFNANSGQPRDLVRHHLTEAVRSSPAVAPLVSCFVDWHARRAPALVCASLERLESLCDLTGRHFLYGLGRRPEEKTLNLDLIEDCLSAIAPRDPDAQARTQRLLLAEHGVSSRPVELLDTSYAPHPYRRQLFRGRVSFERAFDPVSAFELICDGSTSLRLTLVHRAGETDAAETVTLAVNDTVIATVPTGPRWRRDSLIVPARVLRAGRNRITIVWPRPAWDHERWIDATRDLLEAHIPPEVSPTFGQLHTFLAEACAPTS